MMKENSEVSQCPFCASMHTETIEVDIGKWMVECLDCQTTGPIDKSPALAEERWNNRMLYPGTGREIRRYG